MKVVTMGGTSGIGLAVAEVLTDDGAEVTVTGRNPQKLAAVEGRVAHAEQLDGSSEDDVMTFFERIGSFEHLVLAFSPGAVGVGPFRDTALGDIRAAFDGKLFPYLFAAQHAKVTDSITFITAAAARSAVPGSVTSAAVSGALERAVSPLAVELAPVRVNAVSPGLIDTAWWSFLPEDQKQAQFAAAAEGVPVKRIGRPEDVADAVRYLIGAGFVTGTILPVDGGFTVA